MPRELTGRHVLAITLSAFGVVIAVNLWMAVMAVGSFPGLEVPNSYVASQQFDRDRAAQDALGWTVTPAYDGRQLTLAVTAAEAGPASLERLTATVGRPTHARADQTAALAFDGVLFRAPLTLEPGLWIVQVEAFAADGTRFRQRLSLNVRNEAR